MSCTSLLCAFKCLPDEDELSFSAGELSTILRLLSAGVLSDGTWILITGAGVLSAGPERLIVRELSVGPGFLSTSPARSTSNCIIREF